MPIQLQPKYNGKGKLQVINEHVRCSQFGDMSTNVAVVAYDIIHERPRIFRSWIDTGLNPGEIANATSAAPVYFPCARVDDCWYIDGGLVANNPCLIALQEAQRLWGMDADIRILSIGTGYSYNNIDPSDASGWGLPGWLFNGLAEVMMDAPVKAMSDYCEFALPKGHFIRIDGMVPSEKTDDTSEAYRMQLEESALSVYNEKEADIGVFFGIL